MFIKTIPKIDRNTGKSYNWIYRGNIGETTTLEGIIDGLSAQTSGTERKPMVVIDAGIADQGNLICLNRKGTITCV